MSSQNSLIPRPANPSAVASLQHKIDFAVILTVDHANPNGDPLNGNRPRTDYDGFGEISDVCLKRKIRDRLQEMGQNIFVQSDDKKMDGMTSLRARAESDIYGLGKDAFDQKKSKKGDDSAARKEETAKKACQKWFDVRAFGQLFAFGKKADDASGVSIAIRGPVSIQPAFSVEPVSVTSIQITKSVNSEPKKERDESSKSSDTMGMKHRVDRGVYVFYGSINPQLAERTGFSDEDAEVVKNVLPRLFENDASSARPEGSMAVQNLFWWKHDCKAGQYSSARVHKSLTVNADGTFSLDSAATPNLVAEVISGF